MNIQQKTLAAVAALACAAATGLAFAGTQSIASPHGDAVIHIEDDASKFSVQWRSNAVVAPSPLGLELEGAPGFGPLALESREDGVVDRTIPLRATKAASARDHYRSATLTFRESSAPARKLVIDVRAYDDGVAFRYRIDGAAPVSLNGERTAFVLPGDPQCLPSRVNDSHEMPFESLRVSQLAADTAYDVPLVCTTASGRVSFAITQAHLQGYTGASLRREGQALRMHLSAVPNRPGPAYVSSGGLRTAWRVVMLGERAGDMIASNLVGNLNPPPESDFGWVCPARRRGTGGPARSKASGPTRRPIADSSTSRPPAACPTT